MASLELRDVQKRYPTGVTAVESLSLTVDDGECVVLLGPSGCGKTSTLRMIAGLEQVSAGEIRIGGRSVNRLPPRDRNIAMVFQDDVLYPHMSVRRNMSFGLTLRRVPTPEIQRRVEAAAELLGIGGLLDHKPHWLSGGQRQRVSLGRAMVREPALFLFDEPLSHLDARLRIETRAELKRLHRRLGTTTIHVTHDQEEALTLGDRVAVMRDGRIHQCASPLEIYRSPADRFVAGFVGNPPTNFLTGHVDREQDGTFFRSGPLSVKLPETLAATLPASGTCDAVLGVRPQDVELCPASQANTDLRLLIDVVETLGAATDVVLAGPHGFRLVSRIAAIELKEGHETGVRLRTDRANLFEPGDSGRNLRHDAAN